MAGSDEASARTARVLDPDFVSGVEGLPLEELRPRRDEALAAREFLSYLRRLIQVREDLLRAERTRRQSGEQPEPLVERLTAVLSEGPGRGQPRGEALRITLSELDIAEAERRAGAVLGPLALSNPQDLTDEELERALQALNREERGVSADRTAVFQVHDRLQDELKRRYREDPATIPREP